MQFGDQWRRQGLPGSSALIGIAAVDVALDVEQRVDVSNGVETEPSIGAQSGPLFG